MPAHSTFGSNDARQTIRMRSYLMTAATAVLAILLMLIWYGLGMLRGEALLIILTATLLLLLVFFWIFRNGLNLRCTDASLTLPQMAAASLTLLGATFAADSGRVVFLVLLMMVCLFGALRLRTRTLLVHALCVVAGYAAVIGLNGRQVADAARRIRPNLKVLFITGYAQNAAVGDGHMEPGMEVLTKPFDVGALVAKIRQMCVA
jgi:CheY-like chemotaxis protein